MTKMLCFYLAISWFDRVYTAMENWRNLSETFLEEIIIMNYYEKITKKNEFQILIDESNTEL